MQEELDALIKCSDNHPIVNQRLVAAEAKCGKANLCAAASRILQWLSDQASYSVEMNSKIDEESRNELLSQSGTLPQYVNEVLMTLPMLSKVIGIEKKCFYFHKTISVFKKKEILLYVLSHYKPKYDT